MNRPSRSALADALAIQKRAAALGFDWPDDEGPREKIVEEFDELVGAAGNPEQLQEELGDLLFAAVNYARHLGIEPEQALAAANEKFRRRFRYIEARLVQEGLRPEAATLEQMDALWNEAKRNEH